MWTPSLIQDSSLILLPTLLEYVLLPVKSKLLTIKWQLPSPLSHPCPLQLSKYDVPFHLAGCVTSLYLFQSILLFICYMGLTAKKSQPVEKRLSPWHCCKEETQPSIGQENPLNPSITSDGDIFNVQV